MTDLELEAIEKACAEATPGPWGYAYDGSSEWSIGQEDDPQVKTVANVHDRTDERARRDVPFIAGARSWVPALVAGVRRLREANARFGEVFRFNQERVRNAADQARAEALEEAAKVVETHDSSLARLGGGIYDGDRRLLRQRGQELAQAIRALATRPSE